MSYSPKLSLQKIKVWTVDQRIEQLRENNSNLTWSFRLIIATNQMIILQICYITVLPCPIYVAMRMQVPSWTTSLLGHDPRPPTDAMPHSFWNYYYTLNIAPTRRRRYVILIKMILYYRSYTQQDIRQNCLICLVVGGVEVWFKVVGYYHEIKRKMPN